MAIIDLAALTPTKISRDISDKYILIYGLPKVGKTSFAAQCPQNLIFCFEQGVNFQSNIYAVPVTSWSDFKAFLRQLSKQENKDKYKTVTIDTVSWAWDFI